MAFMITMLVRAIIFIVVLIVSCFIVSFLLTFLGNLFNIPIFVKIGESIRSRFFKAVNKSFNKENKKWKKV